MSYDLFFCRRPGAPEISVESIKAYFAARPHFEVSESQALYRHKDTGVYFSFDIGTSNEPGQPADGAVDAVPLSFSLNYFRPHTFGLEAEPEVTAFVRQFDLLVDDPQSEGMGRGEYSPEGFLRGWNHGNEFGYSAILKRSEDPGSIFHLPSAHVERIWRWNHELDNFYKELRVDLFIPTLLTIFHEGRPQTAVVWGDAIPALIPEVDWLFLPRDRYAPRSWFRRQKDVTLIPYAAARDVLAGFPAGNRHFPYRRIEYAQPPNALVEFFRRLKPMTVKPQMISHDRILDREIVQALRPSQKA